VHPARRGNRRRSRQCGPQPACQRPRLLVADEPTVHFDRFSGRAVIPLLERAVEEGTTVPAASHDPDLVAAAHTTLTLPIEAAATAS
jgi:ABC-type ATPase involved in cell division